MADERELADLDAAEEVRIETRAADGTAHRTIIWIVVEGDAVYVRSVNGPTARWYREAVARPDVVVHVSGRALPFTAVPATDATSVAACSTGLERKYRRSYSLASMLKVSILDTTMRLDPA